MLMGGCQSIHQSFVCLSVPRLSVAILTVRLSTNRLSPFHQSTARLSIPQSIHSCFSQHPVTVLRRFDRRLPVYPPDRPSVCLSVCLPSLVIPTTLNHHFDRRLSVCPSTIRHRFDHQLPLCLSLCPLMFILNVHWLSVTVSIADCPSVCLSVFLPVLSCFFANCQSPFRPPAMCLFTDCLSPFLTQTVRRGR